MLARDVAYLGFTGQGYTSKHTHEFMRKIPLPVDSWTENFNSLLTAGQGQPLASEPLQRDSL